MIQLTNFLFLIPTDNLILPGIIFILSIISAYFIDYYSRKTILRFKTKDNAPLRIPIFLFIISLGLNLIVYLNNDLLSSQISYLQTLSQIFTIVIAAILLNRISKSSLADSSVKRKMDVFSLRILQKMSTLSIGFISFWIIIGLFGYDVENNLLLIILVLSTIVLSFAIAKDTLGNLLAGLIIFIWKPFKQGDFLSINDKQISGLLSNIGLTFSKLVDQDQNVTVVPNNLLISNTVSITSGKNFLISLFYKTSSFHNADKIRKLLIQSASVTNYVESKPRPVVLVNDLHGDEFTLELICYTTKYNQIDKIKSNIRTNFLKELKTLGKTRTTRKTDYFDPEEILY